MVQLPTSFAADGMAEGATVLAPGWKQDRIPVGRRNNCNKIITRLKRPKGLGRHFAPEDYHHVKYLKNRERQRNYLILLKKIYPCIKMI